MVPMPKNLTVLPKDVIRNFLNCFDTVLTDCDGVLWMENQLIEGSQHVINKFLEQKKTLFYVTNNSSKVREEYAEKCCKLGFIANEENIISTAYLAAEYLKSINFDKKVYVIGSEGIIKELTRVGIRYTDIGPDVLNTSLEEYVETKLNLDPEVGAVLQGFDQHFSYPKIIKAATYLKDPNVLFLATCPDESFPFNSEIILPGSPLEPPHVGYVTRKQAEVRRGKWVNMTDRMWKGVHGLRVDGPEETHNFCTGSLVRCLEAVSGRKAYVLGKPNDYIREAIMSRQKLEPSRTLMIGDRCNTDILFGNKCGFQTLLVLSGVTSLSDVEKYAASENACENQLVPKFYVSKLGDLLPYM